MRHRYLRGCPTITHWLQLGALNYIAKLGIIFGITITFQGLTMVSRFRWGNTMLSEVFSLLSCISYGSGIWLIAQIFNLNAHYPDGFFWWALGSIPLAFLGQSSLLWFLVIALEIIWAFTEANANFGSTWVFWEETHAFPLLLISCLFYYCQVSFGPI